MAALRLFPTALASALAALAMPANAMIVEADLYPDNARGYLQVHMTITGIATWKNPQGVERTTFLPSRSLDMRLLMVLSDDSAMPYVPLSGYDFDNPDLDNYQMGMVATITACNGDIACQMKVAADYSGDDDEGGMGDYEPPQRFQNWISDRSRPCVVGNASVNDSGNGIAVDPYGGPQPFSFTRKGLLDLADAPDDVAMRVCDARLSWDNELEMVSVRLPAYGYWIDTIYAGGKGDISSQERVQIFDDAPDFVFSLDQGGSWNYGMLSGLFKTNEFGVAYDGNLKAELTASVSWSFTFEQQ